MLIVKRHGRNKFKSVSVRQTVLGSTQVSQTECSSNHTSLRHPDNLKGLANSIYLFKGFLCLE